MDFLRIGKYRLIYGYIMCAVGLALAKQEIFLPGVAVALVGIVLRIWSAGYIEKNDRLATSGPYSLCRNPLYLGSFTFGMGSAIAIRVWWLLPIYILGFALFYVPTVLSEQKFLRGKFGEEFADYCRKVPAFLPYKYSHGSGTFSFKKAMGNREHLHATVHIVFIALLAIIGHFRAG